MSTLTAPRARTERWTLGKRIRDLMAWPKIGRRHRLADWYGR